MPIRHGFHHGFSFILGILLSIILGEVFRSMLPGIFRFIDGISIQLIRVTRAATDVETMSKLVVAFVIVIIYGLLFGILEKRTD
jgi:hypothetical protein